MKCFAPVALALASCAPRPTDADHPNVVLISIDTLRADHLGCYGYERDTSPAIDALAQEGVLFETSISSTSWTLPAHAALFTALPDSVHGADRNGRALASERNTLAEILGDAGYDTAGFWSGPYLHPVFGLGQGFDDYVGCAGYELDGTVGLAAHESSHSDVTSPRVAREVERWLREERGRAPFFLFVHLWDVHYDYIPPEPWASRFDPDYEGPVDGRGLGRNRELQQNGLAPRDLEHLIALYDGEIAWTDHHVGRMLAVLDELGLRERTLVVLTADHGEEFFEHGHFGHRRNLFAESVRVPLILRLPGTLPAGRRVSQLARGIDVAPTILDLVSLPELPNVMGVSLARQAIGSAPDRSTVAVSELVRPRRGDSLRAMRTEDYKILLERDGKELVGLWDLRGDPAEQRNLLDEIEFPDELTGVIPAVNRTIELLGLHHGSGSPEASQVPAEIEAELRALGYLDE